MIKTATFAGGCFWCTQAIFQKLKGVTQVISGYTGGDTENPNYEDVSDGVGKHAESIQITFDDAIITYQDLLDVFFKTHDPTTLNRQQNDIGIQYRSAIFYHDSTQKQLAEETIKQLEKNKAFANKIVTEVNPYTSFYKAENYHQDFYTRNTNTPYCQIIIDPKIQKLCKSFPNLTK